MAKDEKCVQVGSFVWRWNESVGWYDADEDDPTFGNEGVLLDEIERLRAAIDALLTDIDGDHRPEWSSDEAEAAGKKPWCCAWCGAADGGWPCVHRRALDELKEARRA